MKYEKMKILLWTSISELHDKESAAESRELICTSSYFLAEPGELLPSVCPDMKVCSIKYSLTKKLQFELSTVGKKKTSVIQKRGLTVDGT